MKAQFDVPPSSEITDYRVYQNRRQWMAQAAAGLAALGAGPAMAASLAAASLIWPGACGGAEWLCFSPLFRYLPACC